MIFPVGDVEYRKLIFSLPLQKKRGYLRFTHIRTGQLNSTADSVAHAKQTATALCAIARAHRFAIQHRDLHHMTIRVL